MSSSDPIYPATQDSQAPEDEQPAGPGLLMTLPDELIAHIFGQVHAMYMHKKRDMPPPSYLCVCRRITHLARPIWLSVLCAPAEPERAEKFFAGLIRMHRLLEHVKDLDLAVSAVWSDMKTAVVEQMENLETLRLRQIDAGTAQVDRLRQWLGDLSKLRALKIVQPKTDLGHWPTLWNLKDLDFHLSDKELGVALDKLRRVRVYIDSNKPSNLPWGSLQAAEFSLDTATEELPSRFLQQLALQTGSQAVLPLTRLKVVFARNRIVEEFLDIVSSCFRRAAVTSLELRLPEPCDLLMIMQKWPSLRVLQLHAPTDISRDLYFLHSLIQCHPGLCSLTLVGLKWSAHGRDIWPSDRPDRAACYLEMPALQTFAKLMSETTRIVELRVRASDDVDDLELGWYRRAPTDDFEVDVFQYVETMDR